MAIGFDSQDVYTTSGALQIYNTWTENVTKFGTSSFYNWEQDNEPLYDLEERTSLVWEKLGYPTSALPGMSFVVSGDATPDSLECNSNLFTTVSAAIEALPEVIRMPIIIEVANIGDTGSLGDLELNGIKCSYNGSLEIINRAFVQAHSQQTIIAASYTGTPYNYVSGIESVEVSTVLNTNKAIGIDSLLLSGPADLRFNTNNFVVYAPTPGVEAGAYLKQNIISVSPINSTVIAGGTTPSAFGRADYDYNSGSHHDTTIRGYDASVFSEGQNTHLFRSTHTDQTSSAVGLIYGNKFRKIRIRDCNGPIYLRGFAVDGTDQDAASPQGRKIGIEIINSDIFIENLAAARCSEVGIKIINSKVVCSRGLVAYRNYELPTASTRNVSTKGVGLQLINSELTFSALGAASGTYNFAHGNDPLFAFSRNRVGIECINSIIKGGLAPSAIAQFNSMTWLNSSWNKFGIILNNSILDFDGRLDIFNNGNGDTGLDSVEGGIGIDSYNSIIKLNDATIELNQKAGIRATNSHIIYNKNSVKQTSFSETGDEQFNCSANGQHLVLINSTFKPPQVSSMHNFNGNLKFWKHHGVDSSTQPNTLPGVELLDGSRAEFVHSVFKTGDDNSQDFESTYASFGACVAIKEGSVAKFRGTKSRATFLDGPIGYADQTRTALLYVHGNSKAEISGPTVMSRGGVDALVDCNSSIEFSPQKSGAGSYDTSGWELSDYENHTAVELHSTKACLVADHGSTIKMRDLGDYHHFWPSVTALDVDYDTDSLGTSSYHYAGSMQFFPNPIDSTIVTNESLDDLTNGTVPNYDTFTAATFPGSKNVLYNLYNPTVNPGTAENISFGGMCIRALNNSNVDILNVHFPTGYDQCSSVVFDASTDCGKLYIWNIADTSKLVASLLSVSGVYPSIAGYHGPSSVYASAGSIVCSGAPSSTPDTGALSVLDFFALGQHSYQVPQYGVQTNSGNWDLTYRQNSPPNLESTERGRVGQTSWNNQGPFRIMVSVKPEAKFIAMASSISNSPLTEFIAGRGVFGAATQIMAQGYSLSADASTFNTVSSVYANMVLDYDVGIYPGISFDKSDTSGFYYQNRFVKDTSNQILLDESAANTFANAKNGSLGKSNTSKLCSIYQADTSVGGEAYTLLSRNSEHGVGFKSINIFDLTREL